MTRNIAEAIPALSAEGGALVTSAACSPMELAFARAESRFFVDENGFGFVLRYRQWREHAERAIANLVVIEQPAGKGPSLAFRGQHNPGSLTPDEFEQYLAEDRVELPPGAGAGAAVDLESTGEFLPIDHGGEG